MQKSNLTYSMHSAGTTVGKRAFDHVDWCTRCNSEQGLTIRLIEGSWDDVMRLIGQAHFMLHKKGVVRIQSDIRVGSRYMAPAL